MTASVLHDRRQTALACFLATKGTRAQHAMRQRHETRLCTIRELTGADPARILALANAFIKANEADLHQLGRLHGHNDRPGLRQLAHRIKGAAQMTGDLQLSALCAEMERICMTPDATDPALDACVQKMKSAMREFGDSCQHMMHEA